MLVKSQATCWIVTGGIPGMEKQCLGLAAALGVTPVVKRIKLRSPWKQLSPYLRCGLAYAFSSECDAIIQPWPDILIVCGRTSVPAALYIKSESQRLGRPGTFTIHLQDPVIDPSYFDLVIAPKHDGLAGRNVLSTHGSLHPLTREALEAEAQKFAPVFVDLPRPYLTALIGGSNKVFQMTPVAMRRIAQQLASAVQSGGSLLVTASRRTGEENLEILKKELAGVSAYIWDGQGDNPYYGMLGLADAIAVTGESVNMVSEACFTGKPVMLIDLPGGSAKFRRFHEVILGGGFARPFAGRIESGVFPILNDAPALAAEVWERLERRSK